MPGYDEQIIDKLERQVLKAESVTDMLRKDLVPKRCEDYPKGRGPC